jgi:hypothetical protein
MSFSLFAGDRIGGFCFSNKRCLAKRGPFARAALENLGAALLSLSLSLLCLLTSGAHYCSRVQLGSKQYYVSVCGHISNVLCREQAACSLDSKAGNKISYGQPSSAVTLADQTITLTYTSGDSCSEGVLYSSRIIFTCDPNSPPSAPPRVSLLPSDDACVVVFRWYTSLVCAPALPSADCSLVHGGLVYDLTPLALSTVRLCP